MKSPAKTPKEYLDALPPERKKALTAIRKVLRANLPKGYEEGMQYGMIGYYVPHKVYPAGYHCDAKQPVPFASLASQKNHMALYLFCTYAIPEHDAWFRKAWTASGKRLDMGKGCVRFKTLDDVPLDVVADTFSRITADEFIAEYELQFGKSRRPAKNSAKSLR